MLMDNGSPWGAGGAQPFTGFSLWLIRLGIRVAHGRPYHPQTQGKDERLHRTLKFEVLRHFNFTSLEHCQREFDSFRDRYNLVRPHDALGLATPVSRYRPSPIPFPESLPPIEYPDDLEVRKVQAEGWFSYRGKAFRVSNALRGYPIALRQSESRRRGKIFDAPGMAADPMFAADASRTEHAADLLAIVQPQFVSKDLSEWRALLKQYDIKWSALPMLEEGANDPQMRAAGAFME